VGVAVLLSSKTEEQVAANPRKLEITQVTFEHPVPNGVSPVQATA
jgi:hypothetical protein